MTERTYPLGRWTFFWVMWLLVALYVVSEIWGQTKAGGMIVTALSYVGAVFTFHRVGLSRRWLVATAWSAAVVYPLTIAWAITDADSLRSPGDIAAAVLAVVSMVVLMRFILIQRRVSLDLVFAAVAAYILVGLIFGIVYTQISVHWPDVFTPPQPVRADGDSSLFYFSFVVMTTLGFGDISPVNDAVRALTVLQALFGQVFLVVLISRLVGVQIAQRISPE